MQSSTSSATLPSTSSATSPSPKFSGRPTNNILTTSTTADNKQDGNLGERDNEDPSIIIPIVVPVIVALVLLLAVIAVVLLYLRRRR